MLKHGAIKWVCGGVPIFIDDHWLRCIVDELSAVLNVLSLIFLLIDVFHNQVNLFELSLTVFILRNLVDSWCQVELLPVSNEYINDDSTENNDDKWKDRHDYESNYHAWGWFVITWFYWNETIVVIIHLAFITIQEWIVSWWIDDELNQCLCVIICTLNSLINIKVERIEWQLWWCRFLNVANFRLDWCLICDVECEICNKHIGNVLDHVVKLVKDSLVNRGCCNSWAHTHVCLLQTCDEWSILRLTEREVVTVQNLSWLRGI